MPRIVHADTRPEDAPHTAIQAALTACGCVLCFAGSTFLYNSSLVPLLRQSFEGAADLGSIMQLAVFIPIALLAYAKPSLIRLRPLLAIALASYVAGVPLLLAGITHSSAALVAIGEVPYFVASDFCYLLAILACCQLDERGRAVVVPASVVVAYAASAAVALMAPDVVCLATSLLATACSVPFVFKPAAQVLDVVASSEPTAITSVASPSSSLPLSQLLFVFLLLLQLTFGYAAYSIEGSLTSPWGIASAAAFLVLACAMGGRGFLDVMFRIQMLFVVAALLCVGIVPWLPDGTAAGLAAAANCGYLVFSILVLSSISARNKAAALTVFAWGSSLSEVGICIGANLAYAASAHGATDLVSSLIVVLIVACILFVARKLDIDQTIENISVPKFDEASLPIDVDEFIAGRNAVVAREFGLTPREEEIVGMLARGRNGVRIQETLVISRNTYKTHIRHIYEKMGVHDQQEVIDLVCQRSD